LWMAIIIEVCKTIFCNNNFKITNDRVGLTRSAILLILFMVIHAVGNLHVFAGPDDFNGYGYFYVRLYWTGFGLPANIVEEYILLSALLHMLAGLKRTWDITLKESLWSGKLNLAITGVCLMAFMFIHLLQFRFGATEDYLVRPPPYLIYFSGILKLQLFWTDDQSIPTVPVRDIYKLEYDRFTSGPLFPQFWAVYYIVSTLIFVVHGCLGWIKLVEQRLNIPKGHHGRVKIIGYLIFVALGAIYVSFPAYCLSIDGLACGGTCTGLKNLNNQTFETGGDYQGCLCP